MPYLQQSWLKMICNSGQVTGSAMAVPSNMRTGSSTETSNDDGPRTLRTVPHDAHHKNKDNKGATQEVDTSQSQQSGANLQEKNSEEQDPAFMARIQCMHNIVRSQIEGLVANQPALPTDDESFCQYSINVETVMFCGKYSNIYLSYHNDNPEFHLIGRVFEPASKIDPQRSMFLKILKHIGKQHPSLIGTWDIFYDANGRIVIFQEYAMHGNLQEYIKQNNVYVTEQLMVEWAKQIYSGLDFLGDAGIAHRAINPKHILLAPAVEDSNQTVVKLASFRDAIVYYDPKSGRIRNQPCRSVKKRKLANYQAPEVFGTNSEEYDPVVADVWSFGCTFFFVSTRTYPFRYKAKVKDIGQDIQKTIDQAKTLSGDAKRWFSGILCADATRRTPFGKIESDPWYKSF